MPRKGRNLELDVEKLHKVLDDDAVEIKSPYYVKDIDTGEDRELDVGVIKVNPDGSKKLIAIDCRDRQGVEDVRWVEELITKKVSVGADIYYVVTSSNFTAPAQVKALKRGVILRRLDTFSPSELKESLNDDCIEAHYLEAELYPSNFALEKSVAVEGDTPSFYSKKTGKNKTLQELVDGDATKPIEDLDKTMHRHGETKKEKFRMLPEELYTRCPPEIIGAMGELVKVHSYDLEIRLKKYVEKIPLSALKQYKENSNDVLIGELFDYEGKAILSIDKQRDLGRWFMDFSDLPSKRKLMRIKFTVSEGYNLSSVQIKGGL